MTGLLITDADLSKAQVKLVNSYKAIQNLCTIHDIRRVHATIKNWVFIYKKSEIYDSYERADFQFCDVEQKYLISGNYSLYKITESNTNTNFIYRDIVNNVFCVVSHQKDEHNPAMLEATVHLLDDLCAVNYQF